MSLALKILGAAVLVWLALGLIGWVLKALTWALVIGAVVFIGAGVYSAVKGRSQRQLGR